MAIRETERKAPSTYLWSIPNVYMAQPAAYLRVPILGRILFVVTCRHSGLVVRNAVEAGDWYRCDYGALELIRYAR